MKTPEAAKEVSRSISRLEHLLTLKAPKIVVGKELRILRRKVRELSEVWERRKNTPEPLDEPECTEDHKK